MKLNCDAVDEATNNTTESPAFLWSVSNTSAAANSDNFVLLSFCNVFWRITFSHYKHKRSLFKYFKVSSNWTATSWAYLVRVTGNICYGPTNIASIWHRLCRVARNAWSIYRPFHHEFHYNHIKNLIIVFAFLFLMWF